MILLYWIKKRDFSYQKAFEMHPEVKTWKLDTILQEKGNCHLYEKCGFVRVGEEKIINDKMTLIDYELKKL